MGNAFHPVNHLSQLLLFCLILEGMSSLPINRQIKGSVSKQRLRFKRQNGVGNQVMHNESYIKSKKLSINLIQ